MKGLTVALLILGTFASTVFSQSGEQAMRDRRIILAGWLVIVKGAEKKYKTTHDRYGDLAVLRKAHLLDALVFESDSSVGAHREAEANFVPKSTFFQVTVSGDGQHFRATISESLDDGCGVGVFGDENPGGGTSSSCPGHRFQIPPPEDGPEGPIIALPV